MEMNSLPRKFAMRMMSLICTLLCACTVASNDKNKCVTQADCLSGYTCVSGTCSETVPLDGGASLAGSWNLAVTAIYNNNAAIRSHHVLSGTEEADGGITLSTQFCNLYAYRAEGVVFLRADQICTIPTGTVLRLQQENRSGSGEFGSQATAPAPYCYTIWLSSATSGPSSVTSYRFSGLGGVQPASSATDDCPQRMNRDDVTLQFDLSR